MKKLQGKPISRAIYYLIIEMVSFLTLMFLVFKWTINTPEKSATALFLAVLFIYSILSYWVGTTKNLIIKGNLAIINLVAGASLFTCFLLNFLGIFQPLSQAIFSWPALIASIVLIFLGQKEISEYAKGRPELNWRYLKDFSDTACIFRFILPKAGFVLILCGQAILIISTCLNPDLDYIGPKAYGLFLNFLGFGIWAAVLLTKLSQLFLIGLIEEEHKAVSAEALKEFQEEQKKEEEARINTVKDMYRNMYRQDPSF
jgi:hypothetical protein